MRLVGPKALVRIVANHPWSSLRDFVLLSGFMAFAVLMAERYDIFAFIVALADPQRGISQAEGVLLVCLAVGCVGVFIERRLNEARTEDLIARLGGDEFAVLSCNVDRAAARAIGGRFISDGETVEKILRYADVAMYRAKSEAASALVFFDTCGQVSGEPVKALG